MFPQLPDCFSWGHLPKLAVGIEGVNHFAPLGVKETLRRIAIGHQETVAAPVYGRSNLQAWPCIMMLVVGARTMQQRAPVAKLLRNPPTRLYKPIKQVHALVVLWLSDC